MSNQPANPGIDFASAGRRSRWRGGSAWLPLLLVLVALVYWPGLRGGFVFDDYSNIVGNTALHVTRGSAWDQWLLALFSSPASEMQRPLAMLTFAVNYALTGLDPYWMKLTNLGIHLLNTGLVFGLVRRILLAMPRSGSTGRDERMALWVAAAWALNPINLMAVLFVVQRMESLSHTFVFAGLWMYLAGRARLSNGGNGWGLMLSGLLGGTALGVLVKESAILLPLYALALEWALLRFASDSAKGDRRLLALYAGLLVVPGVLGLIWVAPRAFSAGAYANRGFTLGQRLLTEGRVVIDYLHWTLLPDLGQLSLYHDDYTLSKGLWSPPATAICIFLLVLLFGVMLWLRKRRPLMALGLAWFFIAHLLTATVLPLELMFEHRNYFASLGLCLAAGDGLLALAGSRAGRRAGIAAAIALLALYTGVTALRAWEWRDPLSFSISEAAKHPLSPRATYDVARNFILLSKQRSDSPYLQDAFLALDRAMRVPDANALPEAAAITLAARTGRPVAAAWWKRLRHKLRVVPMGPQQRAALSTLVGCAMAPPCALPPEEMTAGFNAALSRGADAEVLNIYGNYALNIQDNPDLALQLWRRAAKLAPSTVQYQQTLARMLIATGQPDQAAAQIARIRQMGWLGQNESIAMELERLLAQARRRPGSPQ